MGNLKKNRKRPIIGRLRSLAHTEETNTVYSKYEVVQDINTESLTQAALEHPEQLPTIKKYIIDEVGKGDAKILDNYVDADGNL